MPVSIGLKTEKVTIRWVREQTSEEKEPCQKEEVK